MTDPLVYSVHRITAPPMYSSVRTGNRSLRARMLRTIGAKMPNAITVKSTTSATAAQSATRSRFGAAPAPSAADEGGGTGEAPAGAAVAPPAGVPPSVPSATPARKAATATGRSTLGANSWSSRVLLTATTLWAAVLAIPTIAILASASRLTSDSCGSAGDPGGEVCTGTDATGAGGGAVGGTRAGAAMATPSRVTNRRQQLAKAAGVTRHRLLRERPHPIIAAIKQLDAGDGEE